MQPAYGDAFGRKQAALFVVALMTMAAWVAVVSLSTATVTLASPEAVPQGLGTFQSYSQLQDYVAANAKSAQDYSRRGTWFGGPVWGPAVLVNDNAMAGTATLAVSSTVSFTGTNVQVQGVDEPDKVKTDGTHLFISNGKTVTIMDAYPPSSAAKLSSISFQGSVIGIEVSQDRLLVINQHYSGYWYGTGEIELLLYNVTDLSSPRLIENMSVFGNYVAARLAQGYLYAVVQQPSYKFDNNGNSAGVLPGIIENDTKATLPPNSVYYTPNRVQISYYTMIVSMNMSTGKTATLSVLTGPSSTIYVSTSNIYVVYTNYQEFYADNIPGDIYTGGAVSTSDVQNGQNSTIIRASYSNGTVVVKAAGAVPGTVLNQFSLDEYGDYFRVATGRFADVGGFFTRSNDLYVLSRNMTQVSALRNIAPGENIYAVRFVGAMGYVVTFQQIDPLFAISFKDVAHPVILSELKVSGYSDYLHPLPGGYLIGVGKDAVPASTGNFAWYLGVKLSLFRVFDNGTSTQVSKLLIGDRGTESPVLTDHLAFTFDSSRNITVMPIFLAKVSGNQSYGPESPPPYGDPVWQGVYVIKVTPDGFTVLGRVSQYPPGQNYGDSPDSNLVVDRSVVIGDYLYTVSQSEVMVSDISTFATVATVGLPS
ncbi:MAG: beta-propeller domain-containing protein [Thaumarchaeota archaeon]|nr:beta-propeller domain-containing protein [Nitrososphaerota archaeon]